MDIKVIGVEPMLDDEMLTASEVADIMKVHIGTVRNWVRKGELAVVWIGSREYRIKRSTLKEFIDKRESTRGKEE